MDSFKQIYTVLHHIFPRRQEKHERLSEISAPPPYPEPTAAAPAAAPNPNPSRHPPYIHITVMPPADDPRLRHISDSIRSIPNWPKEGILFQDITTTLLDPVAFEIPHSYPKVMIKDVSAVTFVNPTSHICNLPQIWSNLRRTQWSAGLVTPLVCLGRLASRRLFVVGGKKIRMNFLWDAGLGGWRIKRETKDGGGSASQAWDRIMKSDESWLQSLSLLVV